MQGTAVKTSLSIGAILKQHHRSIQAEISEARVPRSNVNRYVLKSLNGDVCCNRAVPVESGASFFVTRDMPKTYMAAATLLGVYNLRIIYTGTP